MNNIQIFFSGKEIIQLKNNYIPKGLIPLEDLFDENDVARNPKVIPNNDEVEDYNIGTDVDPKIIKLSKALDFENRRKYIYSNERIYRCLCMEL